MNNPVIFNDNVSALSAIYSKNESVSAENSNAPTSAMNPSSLLSGDSVFSGGLTTLYMFMQMLSDQASGKYAAMNESSEQSRTTQQHLTAIDALIAAASKGGDGALQNLPDEVIRFIEDNNIQIPGVYEDGGWIGKGKISYYFGNGPSLADYDDRADFKLDLAGLNAVKSSMDNFANRASDFVSSSQLQLQKIMQTYNVNVSLINSMQTMLADMNKTIAQGIR